MRSLFNLRYLFSNLIILKKQAPKINARRNNIFLCDSDYDFLLLFLLLTLFQPSIVARDISPEETTAIDYLKKRGFNYSGLDSYAEIIATKPFPGIITRSEADPLAESTTFDQYDHEIKDFTRMKEAQKDLKNTLDNAIQSSNISEEMISHMKLLSDKLKTDVELSSAARINRIVSAMANYPEQSAKTGITLTSEEIANPLTKKAFAASGSSASPHTTRGPTITSADLTGGAGRERPIKLPTATTIEELRAANKRLKELPSFNDSDEKEIATNTGKIIQRLSAENRLDDATAQEIEHARKTLQSTLQADLFEKTNLQSDFHDDLTIDEARELGQNERKLQALDDASKRLTSDESKAAAALVSHILTKRNERFTENVEAIARAKRAERTPLPGDLVAVEETSEAKELAKKAAAWGKKLEEKYNATASETEQAR